MFERWRQENFFKYLREEYALDALVDYGVEPADAMREVPNPRRKALNAEIRDAYAELNALAVELGVGAFSTRERPTYHARLQDRQRPSSQDPRGHGPHRRSREAARRDASARSRPAAHRGRGHQARVERKHLTDLLKMVAYQAESDLVRLVAPHYRRAEDEGRTLIQSALATPGDIEVADGELRVELEPLSSPHRTQALLALCDRLNETGARFPGSKLRLRFSVKPGPDISLAFPGPRPSASHEA